MLNDKPICYWNRYEKREEEERIYGGGALRWLYGTKPGQCVAESILARHCVGKLIGCYKSSRLSRRSIRPFIEKFNILMDDFQTESFRSFNDFFVRRFKEGSRPFCLDARRFPAFAEGRFLAYEKVSRDQVFPVKGEYLTAARLLGSEQKAVPFVGGPMIIARLCPVDYHRFHYPDDGRTLEVYRIRGWLHSVNPLALSSKGDIFVTNERWVTVADTENFGRVAMIEVGAMNVGRIVHTHPEEQPFRRGAEKGYFKFGGSCIILFGEPGRWRPDDDLLERSAKKQEVLVRLGEAIGRTSGASEQ